VILLIELALRLPYRRSLHAPRSSSSLSSANAPK
jgi:hypothetical protein